ncbi:MAG: hypothetical protein IPQ13_02625 [Holophagaceae bacterium]|nr:hypothetical protein [Holophagaceae bacterium]
MKIFRQLGSCGTAIVFLPLAWIAACFLGRALAQSGYERQITGQSRAFRMPEAAVPGGGTVVEDPLALAELQKYLRIWNLEPGACPAFPDASRMPWSWNPLHGSATMMRLQQKQSFLQSQHHEVRRQSTGNGQFRYFIQPDKEAALGGRRFSLDVRGDSIQQARELK